jgi:hypothetical protein
MFYCFNQTNMNQELFVKRLLGLHQLYLRNFINLQNISLVI